MFTSNGRLRYRIRRCSLLLRDTPFFSHIPTCSDIPTCTCFNCGDHGDSVAVTTIALSFICSTLTAKAYSFQRKRIVIRANRHAITRTEFQEYDGTFINEFSIECDNLEYCLCRFISVFELSFRLKDEID